MRGMKLQFSLRTLLICVTVLAVDSALCMRLDEVRTGLRCETTYTANTISTAMREVRVPRPPTTSEIAIRFAWSAPLSIAATLSALWLVRRLRRRFRMMLLVVVLFVICFGAWSAYEWKARIEPASGKDQFRTWSAEDLATIQRLLEEVRKKKEQSVVAH